MKALALGIALVLLAAAAPALAGKNDDDPAMDRARKHWKKGEKLYALSKFADALSEYEKAYEEAELPEFLFNIGQCHRNLHHYDEAIFSFKKYLREKPDAGNRPAVEKLIAELEKSKQEAEDRQADPQPPPEGDDGTNPNHQRIGPVPGNDEPPLQPPADEESHFYQKWWFWTGVVVVAGGATATYFLIPKGGGVPSSDLGNLDFSK